MGTVEKFSKKIQERISQAQKERTEKLSEVSASMKQLLEQKDRYNDAAGRIKTSVICPRMQELSRHFGNSRVTDTSTLDGFYCSCDFSHTPRFPAKVSLSVALVPGQDYTSLDVHYKLDIIPMLMDYKQSDERSFPLETLHEEDIGEWVEARILEFIDSYLKLETNPLYQKENFVVDPVCGMSIPATAAAGTVEREGMIIYFCSEVCKEAYLRKTT